MALFVAVMKPTTGMKILDLGGQPYLWDCVDTPLNITCLNLPGIIRKSHASHHHITYAEGDACHMPYFKPGDFDLVFSNSVIEHVGDRKKRAQFAKEVLRLADQYWIQTPSKAFPIEAHCGMPFWWFYPEALRTYCLKQWGKTMPQWASMVANTTVVSQRELAELLPGCTIRHERFLGVPKSLLAYSQGRTVPRAVASSQYSVKL